MRTVIPEVPVEPAVLGAGLGREVVESFGTSPVVLMAKRYPSRDFETGEGDESDGLLKGLRGGERGGGAVWVASRHVPAG